MVKNQLHWFHKHKWLDIIKSVDKQLQQIGKTITLETSQAVICDRVSQYVHLLPPLSYRTGNCSPTYKTDKRILQYENQEYK